MSAHFENRHHVIGVLFRFKIENQRRKPENAQCRCGKDSAFEARRDAIVQNAFRRARSVAEIIGNFVEETLDAGWRFQRAEFAQFFFAEPKVSRCRSCDERACRAARKLQANRMSGFETAGWDSFGD